MRLNLPLSFLFLVATGCSVYKSTGRKNFEGRSPDFLRSRLIGQSVSDCWQQPGNEPIWNSEIKHVQVRNLPDNNIEVCPAPISNADPASDESVAAPAGE